MQRAVRPSLWVLLMAFVVLVAGRGCKPNTRDNPMGCMLYDGDPPCPMNQHCESYRCVADDAGAAGQGVAGTDGTGGVGTGGEGAGAGGGGGGAGTTGAAGGGGVDAGGGSGGGGGTPTDGGMDGPTNHCQSTDDCKNKTGTTACDLTTHTCVACIDDQTCSGVKPACNTSAETCVECTSMNASACTGAKPVCDATNHACVECNGDGDCKTAEKSFCSKNACVACNSNAACAARDSTKPVCGSSGACVACDTDKDCGGTTPLCGAQKTCISCVGASANSCAGVNSATPVCATSGACVQCGKDADCSPTSTTPFCSDAGTCVGCKSAPGNRSCLTLTPTTPACSSTGACVECVASTDCHDAKPVCSGSNTCGACSGDGDCTNRGPGVCLSNLDGRCASTTETIYVQNNSSCADSGGTTGGTSTVPFCSMQPATAAVTSSRSVIVVRGIVSGATGAFATSVSIVGQSGTIAGTVAPALHVSAGTTNARDLKLTTVDSIGLQADSGSTVQLNHLLVTGNAGQTMDGKGGGILLDGAAFDIRNTTVTSNGPGTYNGTGWGGIFVNNPPSTGAHSLQYVTVMGNNPFGISCSATISGTGVLATGNTSIDVVPACGITPCTSATTSCGAQP